MTPGPSAPSLELRGEMLLEMNEPAQAMEQIRSYFEEGTGTLSRAIGSGTRGADQRRWRCESRTFSGAIEGLCSRCEQPTISCCGSTSFLARLWRCGLPPQRRVFQIADRRVGD